MTTKSNVLILALVAVASLGILIFRHPVNPADQPASERQVCFSKACYQVELARTPEERSKGLMGRDKLDENKGMLFIFETPAVYPFWMKNTKIPLDMLWLNAEKRVVSIAPNVQPCTADPCPVYDPRTQASYVLEIPGGEAWNKGITIGSTAKF